MRNPHPGSLDLTVAVPAFFLGFLSAAFQIILLREFSVQFYGNELTYGLVLASWLFWGGLGSLVAPRFRTVPRGLDRVYYGIILLFPAGLAALRLSRFALGLHPGEMTGVAIALPVALAVCGLSSFPLGALFVLNAKIPGARPAGVYAYESLGAACAGLFVEVALVPVLPNWAGVSLVGAAVATGVFLTFGRRRNIPFFMTALAGLVLFTIMDVPTQTGWWKPFRLVQTKDTPYGKLQLIAAGNQISLYSSGLPVFSCPDPASAETAIHFAMLQNPEARDVLLIGGGAGGGLSELLKYGRVDVDYVELDPGVVRIAAESLPETERRALEDTRVHIHFRDARRFVQSSGRTYDAVILDLPEPATAQINRFFTVEFFRSARSRLASNGVFSCVVPSSENYVGPDLGQFLSSIRGTLLSVFQEVRMVPGDMAVFLASASPLVTDPLALAQRIREKGLGLLSINPASLASRFDPLRVGALEKRLAETPARINRDLYPIGYYFQSVLWSSQFRGLESRILRALARGGGFWLRDVPLMIYVIFLIGLAFRRRRKAGYYLAPLWTLGFTAIVVELALIIAFQASFGYAYRKIALMLASFMAGLFLGSRRGPEDSGPRPVELAILQGALILMLAGMRAALNLRPPESVFYLFLVALGIIGGRLFRATAGGLSESGARAGLGYAADLLGSFFGAVGAAAIFIPLIGIPPLIDALIVMNSFCFLFVVIAFPRTRAA
jgi:spermidine synthase